MQTISMPKLNEVWSVSTVAYTQAIVIIRLLTICLGADFKSSLVSFASTARMTNELIALSDMGTGLWIPLDVPVVCMIIEKSEDPLLP